MRFSNLLWFLIFAALWMTLPRESVALGDPSIVWTLELGPQFAECPVPYPSESPNSLIFATGGHVARVDGSGKVIFQVDLGPEEGRGMMFWPSIADVNGDGAEEIIAGRNDGFVYALNADDGDILWECQLPERLTNYEWADSADLDGDGRAEVVVTTMYGWVYAIDDDGTILWGSKMEDYRPSAPTIADIDSDGEPEIVYGTATRYMIALNAQGDLEWASFQPPHHLGRTVPLVADLDKDGQAEVFGMSSMLSPGKGLVCLNGSDGDLLWYGLTIGKAYSGRALTRFADGSLGVLSCDKGGNIHAHQSDGALRWHNRLSGRGVHNPPVTADIDADGNLEVVATVRDTSTDGEGYNWYVLNADTGEILGAWNHPKLGFMGPAVLDIDRDGDLEVILCSKEGTVTAYSFGGPAIPESVAFGNARQRTFPVRVAAPHEDPKPTVAPIQLIDEIPLPRFGSNLLTINLPDSEEGSLAIELSVTDPDGFRSIQVFHGEDGQVEASWRALIPGDYGITLRLLDLDSNKTLGSQELSLRLKDVGAIADLTQEALNHFEDSMREGREDNLVLQLRASEIEARFAKLSSAIQKSLEMNVSQRRTVADDADEYVQFLARSVDFSSLVSSEISSGRKPKFVCWQDENPWDNRNPLDDLPVHGEPPVIRAWAFGNEKESVCFNILNLSNDPLTLRVEPGKVTGPEPLPKVSEVTTLHRVLWLPTSDSLEIADLLPRLDEGYLLDLAPGEARQLWINLSTRELSEGVYEFVWPLRSLDMDSRTIDLTVQLEVSPVRLPENSRFYTGYWSRTNLDGYDTIPDL
ncbi:MAG: PQQ-binding-like beta-propeller repeat protein, partial [Candidatus Omnitrophica bacterium]|nr:PQQ-binding-like beta-propeller repeat protein [Candidatus Omnitrophota bacterium]